MQNDFHIEVTDCVATGTVLNLLHQNLCESIFNIPAQNRAKHFSPYIARSLAVLSEKKEERAFLFSG